MDDSHMNEKIKKVAYAIAANTDHRTSTAASFAQDEYCIRPVTDMSRDESPVCRAPRDWTYRMQLTKALRINRRRLFRRERERERESARALQAMESHVGRMAFTAVRASDSRHIGRHSSSLDMCTSDRIGSGMSALEFDRHMLFSMRPFVGVPGTEVGHEEIF